MGYLITPDKTEMVVQLVQKRILQTEKPVYSWHSSHGQSAVPVIALISKQMGCLIQCNNISSAVEEAMRKSAIPVSSHI